MLNVGTARGGLVMYPDQDALIDITEGTLVLEGDEIFKVEDLIERGQIIAYGGDGFVEYDFDGVSTIVTACPPPTPSGWMFAGDFNSDGSLNVSDPVALLNHLFGGVYVQKPLAHTITESRMLAKAAKKYNVKTQREGDRESPVLRPS